MDWGLEEDEKKKESMEKLIIVTEFLTWAQYTNYEQNQQQHRNKAWQESIQSIALFLLRSEMFLIRR